MTKMLTKDFLDKYADAPEHMNELGAFVFYRTYSRWIPDEGRRETWKEAVTRAVEYSIQISIKELQRLNLPIPWDNIRAEAEATFDNVYNLRQFLSGRTHWVGGAESGVADKFPLANFNCSFLNITDWKDLGDLFYLLLVGTGVGFKSTKEMARNMSPIRWDFDLIHQPYTKRYPLVKEPETSVFITDTGRKAVIHVGDSKEGWVSALREFFKLITDPDLEDVKTISVHYDYIREKGSRLKTFGGTASGYEPLRDMFEGIKNVIMGTLDPTIEKMESIPGTNWLIPRPIHILDIGNLIGNNVVVGGVRRTAEIFLSDADDWEVILAKYGINGIWDENKHNVVIEKLEELGVDAQWLKDLPLFDEKARPLHHRRMSNNSIAFEERPSREMLSLVFAIMQAEGEPGFVNLEAASRRRPNMEGLNPCAEILLDSYGVCNLTTVNVDAFVKKDDEGEYQLDFSGLMEAQALSTRIGVRMTLLDLEIPHWNDVHKRDRLIGTSLTGWYDAMDKLNYSVQQEEQLLNLLSECSRTESIKYAHSLRIPVPLLTTTVKPEGTLSQVAGGVSSGLHRSHSQYYIRRVRINANDPLAKVAKRLDWTIHAEVGTEGFVDVKDLAKQEVIDKARTLVIDFPVDSGAITTKDDVNIDDQFDTYFRFQEHYTEHNASNTISVRPDEWERAEQIVWDSWDDFIAVSFLAHDGGSYTLAPYEAITKEQYEELKSQMKPFSPESLQEFENKYLDKELAMQDMEGCEGGACPIF